MDHVFLNYGSWWTFLAKKSNFDFWHQMTFVQRNLNSWFLIDAFSEASLNLWMDSWGPLELIESHFEVLAHSQMKISLWRPQSIKTLICHGIVQSFAWFLMVGISWSLWTTWSVEDHANSWLVLCMNIWDGNPNVGTQLNKHLILYFKDRLVIHINTHTHMKC